MPPKTAKPSRKSKRKCAKKAVGFFYERTMDKKWKRQKQRRTRKADRYYRLHNLAKARAAKKSKSKNISIHNPKKMVWIYI